MSSQNLITNYNKSSTFRFTHTKGMCTYNVQKQGHIRAHSSPYNSRFSTSDTLIIPRIQKISTKYSYGTNSNNLSLQIIELKFLIIASSQKTYDIYTIIIQT